MAEYPVTYRCGHVEYRNYMSTGEQLARFLSEPSARLCNECVQKLWMEECLARIARLNLPEIASRTGRTRGPMAVRDAIFYAIEEHLDRLRATNSRVCGVVEAIAERLRGRVTPRSWMGFLDCPLRMPQLYLAWVQDSDLAPYPELRDLSDLLRLDVKLWLGKCGRELSEAREAELSALDGSPKQVRWAESVRRDILGRIEAQLELVSDNLGVSRFLELVIERLGSVVSANFWIDTSVSGTRLPELYVLFRRDKDLAICQGLKDLVDFLDVMNLTVGDVREQIRRRILYSNPPDRPEADPKPARVPVPAH